MTRSAVGEVDLRLLGGAVHDSLGLYAKALGSDFSIDQRGAARLAERQRDWNYNHGNGSFLLMGSSTPVESFGGRVATLDVVVLPPLSGTGDLRDAGATLYHDDYPRHAVPYVAQPAVRRLAVMSLASFPVGTPDAPTPNPPARPYAMRLRKTTIIGNSVVDAAMIGQSDEDFLETMTGTVDAHPQAVTTVDTDRPEPWLSPVEAFSNDTYGHLQVVGLISVAADTDGSFALKLFDRLDAQPPTELLAV